MTETDAVAALREALMDYMSAFGQALESHGIPFGEQQVAADHNARQALSRVIPTAAPSSLDHPAVQASESSGPSGSQSAGASEPAAEVCYAGILSSERLQFIAVKGEFLPDKTKLFLHPATP